MQGVIVQSKRLKSLKTQGSAGINKSKNVHQIRSSKASVSVSCREDRVPSATSLHIKLRTQTLPCCRTNPLDIVLTHHCDTKSTCVILSTSGSVFEEDMTQASIPGHDAQCPSAKGCADAQYWMRIKTCASLRHRAETHETCRSRSAQDGFLPAHQT